MKIILLLFILIFPNTAFAYLDPGTGGGIIQALIAFFGAIAFYISYPFIATKRFYNKIKDKIFRKKDKEKDKE